jgi:hypothetical protein
MAVALEAKTISVTPERRTWRTEVFSEKGEVPTIRFHREALEVDADGKIKSRDRLPPSSRVYSDIAGDTVSVGGKTYSATLAAAILAAFGDKYGEEDFAARQAAAEEAAQQAAAGEGANQ